jgi:hypothetical protein
MRPLAPLALLAVAVALAAALAGCGSSASPGSTVDPATVIPASAPLFADASVRPSGSLKSAALAAGKALTHQANPYLRLLGALQTPGAPQLSFAHDIAPWLGPSAGVYLSSLASAGTLLSNLQSGLLGGSGAVSFPFDAGGAQGAIVLDTSDASKAQSFLDAQASHAGAHATSYRGIAYKLSSGGVAFGLVHRLAVIGSESGIHGVIDTALGGASLQSSSAYSKLLAKAPTDTLAHLYSNPAGAISTGPAEGISGLLGLLAGPSETNISVVPSSGSLTLDADTLATNTAAGLLSSNPESAKALSELPGESWLAVGLGHVGSSLSQFTQGLSVLGSLASIPGVSSPEGSAASGLSIKSLLGAMLAPLQVLGASSAQARHDFAGWMGSAGMFASGGSLLELKAAIVISSKDPTLSRAAVAKLTASLQKKGASPRPVSIPGTDAAAGVAIAGLPVVLDIADGRAADGQTKFVLGFGEPSVEEALNPSSTMSSAAPRSAASTALGEGTQPSVLLDFPTLLTLLEGVGLTSDPSISPFVPYLRSLSTLAGGGHDLGGEVQRFGIVLGLQQNGG